MKKNIFKTRLLAALIDYSLIFVLSYTLCTIIILNVFTETVNLQMAPFVLIQLLLSPFSLLVQLISSPKAFGDAIAIYMLFGLSLIIEIAYFSIFELLPLQRTPGCYLLKIHFCLDSKKHCGLRIVVRNVLKVFSRYLFCIPFIISLFSKSGKTLYDKATKIYILKDE